jgi:hypothetical protein
MHRIAFAQTALRSRVQATPRLRSISHNSFVGDTINIRANQHKSHRLIRVLMIHNDRSSPLNALRGQAVAKIARGLC